MNKIPFRPYHLLQFFEFYEQEKLPLDFALNLYFKKNKALGAKDRSFIAEHVFLLIRNKALLDLFAKTPKNWESRFYALEKIDLEKEQASSKHPLHVRCSLPKFLFEKIMAQYGEKAGEAICWELNNQAPFTIRANLLKISREDLLRKWGKKYPIEIGKAAPASLMFKERTQLFKLPEFKEGLFEVQDEGSQALCELVDAQEGEHLLDFCAGSGGKALGIAPKLKGKGQIYLHDIRIKALEEAKKRLKRAGIQNAQILPPKHPTFKKLKKKVDWVFVDAPCSGTGTLRRNPDMKWKLTPEMIENLKKEQRKIFEEALSYVKPGGKIIYATCSLLKEENEEQIDYFLSHFPLKLTHPPFQSVPKKGRMDGFFGAVMEKVVSNAK